MPVYDDGNSGGGGSALPDSSTDNFDFLVPDGAGGWRSAQRKIGTTDFSLDEWDVTDTLDPSSSYTVTQSGNELIIEIQSPSSATSQNVVLNRRMELPNFLVYGHIRTSANNVGWQLGGYPADNGTNTRDLYYQAATTATGSNIARTRNGSATYPSMGTLTRTTGAWFAYTKSGDAMGMNLRSPLTESVSPRLELRDFTSITRSQIEYNATSYQYRAGTTGANDALTQDWYFTINCTTPAATGTYSVTFSYLELFPL